MTQRMAVTKTEFVLFRKAAQHGHFVEFLAQSPISIEVKKPCWDVRDAISSMFKLRFGEASWCESWVPPIIETKLARDPMFRTRYGAELEIIENCDTRLVGLAALYWKYKTDALFAYRAQGFPVALSRVSDWSKSRGPYWSSSASTSGFHFTKTSFAITNFNMLNYLRTA
jgi:hypothetical protein